MKIKIKKMNPAWMILLCLLFSVSFADEGMWTFDNLPVKVLQEKYGFTPTQEWLDHVRLASVRFNDGGSGSFVSPNGLVMTNHHVGVGQLQKISTKELDYVTTGFYAASQDDEIKCPDLELNILVKMKNITKKIQSAVKKGMSDEEALKARKAKIAEIEKTQMEKTGLRSDVVKLYHGGEYWLYQYKKYTDIRMVMAPERQAAYFGGDFDNFTFPRYDLDVAFFRVYENDKPLQTEHFLKWNSEGAKSNDLVFVSGNPGSTDRLYTFNELLYKRDVWYPIILDYIKGRIDILHAYGKLGEEQERRALIRLFGLENGKKALTGELQGLRDKKLMAQRKKDEDDFRKKVASNSEWDKKYSDSWQVISDVTKIQSETYKERFYGRFLGSKLASMAKDIVFIIKESQKPDADRLDGYHESEMEELKFYTLSPAPIYSDLEEANLAGCLQISLDQLGADNDFITMVIGDKSPKDVAKELIQGTKLTDVEFRKQLLEGGEEALKTCEDPLIQITLKLEPLLRKRTKWHKKNIESRTTPAREKIAQARFTAYGKDAYPDATFTLRLSFGTVKGYAMNGTKAPYKTTLYGLYDRSISFDGEKDFVLPQRFWDRQDQLDLSTPVNFVMACDIIGGNSGSPVININGDVIGLIFDGNIESLSGRFLWDEEKNRAVAVHTAYIMEALRKLYDANQLADEIEGK